MWSQSGVRASEITVLYLSVYSKQKCKNLKTDDNVLYCTFVHISLHAKQTIMHYTDAADLFGVLTNGHQRAA